MPKDFAIITVHGMGDTDEYYYKKFEEKLRKEVGGELWDSRCHLESVYYQGLLQDNQERYWKASNDQYGLKWDSLRKFILFSFSDAASIEHSLRGNGELYEQVHQEIATAFDNAYEALGNEAKPVFVIAHSLGAQEISNYIWDAMENKRLFSAPSTDSGEKQAFRRFSHCYQFITIGCNIPVFKAGLPKPTNFERPNGEFTWNNYFDVHDVLGYPIKNMAPSFEVEWINDLKVKVGGFFTGWNPISHTKYWTDKDVVRPIAQSIQPILA